MYLKVIVNVFISLIFVISFLKGPFQSFKQFFSSRVHGIIIQVNPNLINIKMSDWPVIKITANHNSFYLRYEVFREVRWYRP